MITVELEVNLGRSYLKSVDLPCLPSPNDYIYEGKIAFVVRRNEFVMISGNDVVIGTKLDLLLEDNLEDVREYLDNRGWQRQ